MLKCIANAFVLLGIVTTSLPAQAQSQCSTRANLVSQLAEKYGEVSQGAGLQNASQVIEVWSSKRTGSWTIIASRADGMSCILATGRNWIENPAFATTFDEKVSF